MQKGRLSPICSWALTLCTLILALNLTLVKFDPVTGGGVAELLLSLLLSGIIFNAYVVLSEKLSEWYKKHLMLLQGWLMMVCLTLFFGVPTLFVIPEHTKLVGSAPGSYQLQNPNINDVMHKKFIDYCRIYVYPARLDAGLSTGDLVVQFLIGLALYIVIDISVTLVLILLANIFDNHFEIGLVDNCMIAVDLAIKFLLTIVFGKRLLPIIKKLFNNQ
ncbi:hypothetical protein [Dyadobacter sp. 22481]|uniref:hypothetical protein n=1 Tax=Dyadobacter sp. 22481 TaxID=3453926 RepID=UPI003F85E359